MSDGSDILRFRRIDTFAVERQIAVVKNGARQPNLNELECVKGDVYAIIPHRDFIVRIEASTGRVLDRIEASSLLSDTERRTADFLDGIAYDPDDGLFYLTGQLWPWLYKVRFVPETAPAAPRAPSPARTN